jgi:nitrogenase molybdenum-iron protein alpha/beta subunit
MFILKGLLRKLPPFAPDYSGVNAAFSQLGGVIIIAGADGCIGNINGYDNPKYFYEKSLIFSSGLREIRAITGDEEILMQKINDLNINKDVKFILLLATPTSAIIASNHKGVSKILSKEVEIPVISINTTGINTYEKGLEKALFELAKRFVKPYSGIKKGVNIIGCTPLDYWGYGQYKEIKKSIENSGLEVNSFWSMEGGLEGVEKTLKGEVNLVVSTSGIKAAKYLEKKYNIPYLVDVPIGKKYSEIVIEKLKNKINKTTYMDKKIISSTNEEPVLIIGDQVYANSFRNYLIHECNMNNVKVASFFNMKKDYLEEGDVYLDTENALKDLLNSYKPHTIIGDPLYKRFVSDGTQFINIPHLAVSSRLHWNHKTLYVGENINIFKDERKRVV